MRRTTHADDDAELTLLLSLPPFDWYKQRLIGDRSYKAMFTRYKFRVFIAMSAQAFAQLVSFIQFLLLYLISARRRSLSWAPSSGRGHNVADVILWTDSLLTLQLAHPERHQRHFILCAPRL